MLIWCTESNILLLQEFTCICMCVYNYAPNRFVRSRPPPRRDRSLPNFSTHMYIYIYLSKYLRLYVYIYIYLKNMKKYIISYIYVHTPNFPVWGPSVRIICDSIGSNLPMLTHLQEDPTSQEPLETFGTCSDLGPYLGVKLRYEKPHLLCAFNCEGFNRCPMKVFRIQNCEPPSQSGHILT